VPLQRLLVAEPSVAVGAGERPFALVLPGLVQLKRVVGAKDLLATRDFTEKRKPAGGIFVRLHVGFQCRLVLEVHMAEAASYRLVVRRLVLPKIKEA